ncbi:MAG: toll/interleukin-1 receptor domain-containing protein [Clostridia bacterium]|nr:toll/interleukin-1 receptor domain-containing protein [Clostridia bacterium]
MDKKEIFISYRSTESAHAYYIKDFLETNGFSVWMAPESIPVGSDYATEIPTAIRNCSAVVLILSRKAQRSKWVRKEINTAFDMGKTVMPFMVEKCKLTEEFNFYLSNVQRYEAYANKSEVLRNMLLELCKITNKEAPEHIVEDIAKAPKLPDESAGDFVPTATENFLLRLTPYGRRRAKEPKVRTLLHTATAVLAVHAIPIFSVILEFIKYAPIMPVVFIAMFMLAWYMSYGVCLRVSQFRSKSVAVIVTAAVTFGIISTLFLATAAITPAFMR